MSIQDITHLFKIAIDFYQAGNIKDAEKIFEEIVKKKPSDIGSKTMLGTIYVRTQREEMGIKLLKSSFNKDPKQFWALNSIGLGNLNLKKFDEAEKNFRRAISINSNYFEAFFNLGITQKNQKKFEDAYDSYTKCLDINPNSIDAAINRANLMLENICNYDLASKEYRKIIEKKPNNPLGYYGLAKAFKLLGDYENSLKNYLKSIEIDSNFSEGYFGIANIHYELKNFSEAYSFYSKAYDLNPKIDFLIDSLVHCKMQICHWDDLNIFIMKIREKIESTNLVSPFSIQSLIDDPDILKKAAINYTNIKFPPNTIIPNLKKNLSGEKIKVAYISADFYSHAMMFVLLDIFEHHNRDNFEIYAFSIGPKKQDKIRRKLEGIFDYFFDLESMNDYDAALTIRKKEIDIAIDLNGFTQNSRTNIFALKVAPIQINYLGFPSTLGASYYDYILADIHIIPEKNQKFYTEKIVYLPDTYQPNMSRREISNKKVSSKELELPDDKFIFCSFSNPNKITPNIFKTWMNILKESSNSVLWLIKSNDEAVKNLQDAARKLGIDPQRLIFSTYMKNEEYLNVVKKADLYLDTYPYNGHGTTSDIIRVGVPLITCYGESFPSRVAKSLLMSVKMPELITSNLKNYQSLAVELSKNNNKLLSIRKKLKKNVISSHLFNSKQFTKNLEKAFTQIYQNHHKNISGNIKI